MNFGYFGYNFGSNSVKGVMLLSRPECSHRLFPCSFWTSIARVLAMSSTYNVYLIKHLRSFKRNSSNQFQDSPRTLLVRANCK
jgi:hypothetical protein